MEGLSSGKTTIRKGILLSNVTLFEDNGLVEPSVEMNEGTEITIIHEYPNMSYLSGWAYVIFDGQEAVSVDSSLIGEVE